METSGEINPPAIFSAKGIVAVVSGSGSGSFSRAPAWEKVADSGMASFWDDVLTAAATSLDPSNTKVIPLRCDVTSDTSIAAAVQQIEADTGCVDVLANNAGIAGPLFDINAATSVDELSAGLLEAHRKSPDVLACNTISVIGITTALLPLLDKSNKRRGWRNSSKLGLTDVNTRAVSSAPADINAEDHRSSQIITISSIAGIERHGLTGLAYSASKAGSPNVGMVFFTMLARWNIRSKAILPGLFPSEMAICVSMADLPFGENPTGRAGCVEDVAGFVLYLAGQGWCFRKRRRLVGVRRKDV
ncbi:hypothetical protein SLS56_011712 [Neofusicoccum ribis]|uniref:NAD(P)-binding protein n=1 Tax=Neofusicoccum ribis TaxID=45134 RepID=A0ABR3SAY0_9PEZI